MQIQYLATAVARREKARASSSPPQASSYERASRSAASVAASDSTARSASTFCMRGCSDSRRPNALRCAAWWVASATARRISPVEPSTQSRRVWFTISMIVGTPRPSGPTSRAYAPWNSTSDDAFDRFPSLSFRRWMWNAFRVPSGLHRGSRKHDSPPGAWARTRNASHMGAEQNHFAPWSSYSPAWPTGSARVVLARTSEPPCRSVMAIPESAPAFSVTGAAAGSYSNEVRRGSHSAWIDGSRRRAGMAAYVIDSGHPNPCSA